MTLISIIIPTFNSAATLKKTLDSVIGQTLNDWEVLIPDGGSTDATNEIIREYGSEIKWTMSEKDKGITDAWNKALLHANGDWIYFLGSDDTLYYPDVLKEMAVHLERTKNKIVYGKVTYVKADGTIVGIRNQNWEKTKNRFFKSSSICHQGIFHHRSLFETLGQFDVSLKSAADYDFLMRCVKVTEFEFVDMMVANFLVGGLSSAIGSNMAALKEISKVLSRHGYPKDNGVLRFARFKNYLKSRFIR